MRLGISTAALLLFAGYYGSAFDAIAQDDTPQNAEKRCTSDECLPTEGAKTDRVRTKFLGPNGTENMTTAAQGTPFSNVFYRDTDTLQAGYHFWVGPQLYHWDAPGGKGCGGDFHFSEASFSGTMPPGLEFLSFNGTIEGTPRQAGRWRITVALPNIQCVQGPDQSNYGMRYVNVNFNIKP